MENQMVIANEVIEEFRNEIRSLKAEIAQLKRVKGINGDWEEQQTKVELSARVSSILKEFEIPVQFKGFSYLLEAIQIVYKNNSWIHGITTDVYPLIAMDYGTKGANIERSIRNAIETTWEKQTPTYQKYGFRRKPTNLEFISFVVELLKTKDLKALQV